MVMVHSFHGGRHYVAEIRPDSGIRIAQRDGTTEITFSDHSKVPLTLVMIGTDASRLLGHLNQAGVVEPAVLDLPTAEPGVNSGG